MERVDNIRPRYWRESRYAEARRLYSIAWDLLERERESYPPRRRIIRELRQELTDKAAELEHESRGPA